MSMNISIPQGGVEYVKLTYGSKLPLNFPTKAAFMTGQNKPTANDWVEAEWEDDEITSRRTARVLVKAPQAQSNTGHELPAGNYTVWGMVEGNPERVVRNSNVVLTVG